MKKRVISALILIAIAGTCIFLSDVTRVLFFAAAGLLCAYELSRALEKLEVYCCAWVMYVFTAAEARLSRISRMKMIAPTTKVPTISVSVPG